MSIVRLRVRVPNAQFLAVATLAQHSLRFHKAGSDNSGKCDAYITNNDSDVLWGVVFEMPREQRAALDEAEGLGVGYKAKQVDIVSTSGEHHNALTYYAIKINTNLAPYDWYINHVLNGAREINLPKDYIAAIESIDSITDPKKQRSLKEYSIHN